MSANQGEDRLFAVPKNVTETAFAPGHSRWSASIGAIGEARLVAELLWRGHKVARPVSDDDGVDLVVNYRTTVQVKTCARPRKVHGKSQFPHYHFNLSRPDRWLASHIDVIALHAVDAGYWWLLPRHVIGTQKGIQVPVAAGKSFAAQWREAWDVFDQ